MANALQETNDAKEMLDTWKNSYMEIRKEIEENGKGKRWEFDKKKLFGTSDYISSVCKDLNEVAMVSLFARVFSQSIGTIFL